MALTTEAGCSYESTEPWELEWVSGSQAPKVLGQEGGEESLGSSEKELEFVWNKVLESMYTLE